MANRLGTNDPIYDASRLNTINLVNGQVPAVVNAITALHGDATATGPGDVAITFATVNTSVGVPGTFGSATQSARVTINAKGQVTAVDQVTIAGISPVGAALTRGSIYRGSAAGVVEALALGGISGSVITRDATDTLWSTYALAGTAAQTYTFPPTSGSVTVYSDLSRLPAQSFTVYDDFLRADTSPGTLGTAPSGHVWDCRGAYVSGYPLPAAETGQILNRRYVSVDTTHACYATITLRETVTRIGARVSWTVGNGGSQAGVIAMIISLNDNFISDMLHFYISPGGWTFQLRVAGGSFDVIASETFATPLSIDGTSYPIEYSVAGDTITIMIAGHLTTVKDARVAALLGKYVVWEITYLAEATYSSFARIDAVWTGSSPVGLWQGNLYHQVATGRVGVGSSPAYTFDLITGSFRAGQILADGSTVLIGNGTISADHMLHTAWSRSTASGTSSVGIYSLMSVTPTENMTAGSEYALLFNNTPAGAYNHYDVEGVGGFVVHSGSGVIRYAFGARFGIQLSGTGGSITDAWGMIVPTPARATGTNTIGTAYGLEIDAQKTAFVTTAYAINQLGASDLNYLAGVTSIGTTAANAVLNIGTSGVDSEAQAIQMVVPESAAGSARIGLHTTAGRQQAYIKLSKLLANTTRKGQIDLMLNPGTLEDGIAGLSIIDTGAGTGASNVGISTQLAGVGVTYQKLNVNGSQLFVGADSSQESPMLQIVPSYATNTHASYKARAIVSIWDIGGARSALQIDTDGSKASVQINSLHYGSMYADDITQVVTIGSAGAYVKVPGSMTVGLCNGFTLASSRELTCTIAGTYKVAWSMSVYSGSNNEIIGGAAMVNTTEAHQTENASECINSGKPVSISGHGEITLAVNDVVALCVENETAAHDITVTHANLSVIRIGA